MYEKRKYITDDEICQVLDPTLLVVLLTLHVLL